MFRENKDIIYSTSVWDLTSTMEICSLKPEFIKIPSATNLNFEIYNYLCENYEGQIQISTGMTTKEEIENIPVARKSLVAAKGIMKGGEFSEANVTAKRPGDKRSPMEYWDLLGRLAERNYEADDCL